jgi:site-specific DNA-methyltransferase (adenine-specific)
VPTNARRLPTAPYYQDDDATLYHGDCRAVLAQLPAGSVHCCVTSPPYWGLRDYGLEPSVWDDPGDCTHVWGAARLGRTAGGGGNVGINQRKAQWDGRPRPRRPSKVEGQGGKAVSRGTVCQRCGAWRGCLGLEPDPASYVQHLVEVLRGVKRVLRDDGTCWLNLGDCFLPDKNEALLPHRVALALVADGWICRSTMIWHKLNPMPESVTDRPTKSHEYVFLLSKRPRYYYDAEAIAEPTAGWRSSKAGHRPGQTQRDYPGAPQLRQAARDRQGVSRNRRSVWTLATQPYTGAHFATFPPKLIEPCVLAGSPPGGTVLDPFAGAGTVALVARQHGRASVGIELNPAYCALTLARLGVARAEVACAD